MNNNTNYNTMIIIVILLLLLLLLLLLVPQRLRRQLLQQCRISRSAYKYPYSLPSCESSIAGLLIYTNAYMGLILHISLRIERGTEKQYQPCFFVLFLAAYRANGNSGRLFTSQ